MTQTEFKLNLNESVKTLIDSGKEAIEFFSHGSLSVKLYKPDKVDKQTPHIRDEVYVIASGSGTFVYNGEKTQFEKGDFLFVPAGIEHYFKDFTNDFITWVFFYGYEGGESYY